MKIHKKDAEKSRLRMEAWWNHEILDRAVIQVESPLDINPGDAQPPLDDIDDPSRYFTDPDVVIPRTEYRLAHTYFGGESFPVAAGVPTRMVAILASYLGCPVSFLDAATVWTAPIIDDLDALPNMDFNPDNEWWKSSRRLMECFSEAADGYHVCIPDLNGPTEILARMRSPEKLAFDLIDNPDYIKRAIDRITDAWFRYWEECTEITQKTEGFFYWMGIWSNRPSIDLQSDFSCMISSEMFNEHFIPSIEKQTHMVERTIYHLDGPGAIRHLDALLELPKLNGIQWVAGAGSKPTIEWIPLLKRIQDAGKLVYVGCRKEHVETLLKELDPAGLLLSCYCKTPEEVDALVQNVEKWTAGYRKS
jgi:hypothetical protein